MLDSNYPKISSEDVTRKDFMNQGDVQLALQTLKNLTFNVVTPDVEGGAADSTVTALVFIAPTKMQIEGVKFLRKVMNTGAGNTPEVLLQNGEAIIAQEVIPLTGEAGDVTNVPLVPDHVIVEEGSVLSFVIMTPDETITTKLKGLLQIEWKSVI